MINKLIEAVIEKHGPLYIQLMPGNSFGPIFLTTTSKNNVTNDSV